MPIDVPGIPRDQYNKYTYVLFDETVVKANALGHQMTKFDMGSKHDKAEGCFWIVCSVCKHSIKVDWSNKDFKGMALEGKCLGRPWL